MVQKNEFFYKALKSESPSYLFNTIPNTNTQRQREIHATFPHFDYFKNSFFLSAITKCNKLDCCISNADLFETFKKRILSFIRPMQNSIYNIRNPLGVKYLTRLRTGFSHLKEHKFKHNFQDSIDPMCSCSSCLKQRFIFFSIAQILILKDKPSLTKQLLHMRTFWLKMKIVLLILSYLENQIVKIILIKQC